MARPYVCDVAEAEIGYIEKKKGTPATGLYAKNNKYNGTDNYTKYAHEIGHPNGQYWCQTFIAWLFFQAYGAETADKLLCDMLESAYTIGVKDAFKKAGQLVPVSEAIAGDIMFRSRTGGGHVGLCVGRENGKIVTIEGNTDSNTSSYNGGQVARHVGAYWEWCARPDYSIINNYTPNTWYSDDNGWWYAKSEKEYCRNEWRVINGCMYYFNDKGYAVTGDQIIDGKRYYFEPTPGAVKECALLVTNANNELELLTLS